MTGRLCALVLLVAVSIGVGSAAAAVEVGASLDRNRMALGEQVVLTVSVRGDGRDVSPPQLPLLEDFLVHGGGQSQRFSFVNGRANIEHSFTFYLQPKRTGEFRIGPVTLEVDGTSFRTNPIGLEVVAAGSAPTGPAPGASSQGTRAPGESAVDEDAFVTLTVDRDSVVVGEQLVLTFGFHRATRMSAFENPEYTPPRTEGFWREDLPPDTHTTRVIRSRRFHVTEIRYALFPTRAGDLVIEPATVRLPEDLFDSFFRRSNQPRRGPRVLTTDQIVVHVDPLPPAPTGGFTGAVGAGLRLDASVDRREVDEGEAITLRLSLRGEGHLPGMPPPDLGELEDFRVHDAGTAAESRPQQGRLVGNRVIEKLLLPRGVGELEIPSVRYVYFDTERRRYVTLETEPIAVRVRAVEGGTSSVFAGGRKSEIELLARDILHIAPIPSRIEAWSGPLPNRTVFWALLATPALLWAASASTVRRRERMLADPRRLRARTATSRARKVLDGDGPADRRAIRALHGWVADRADRAMAGLTHDDVQELLRRSGVDAGLVAEVRALLDRCDAARYAPAGAGDEEIVARARDLVTRLEEATRAR